MTCPLDPSSCPSQGEGYGGANTSLELRVPRSEYRATKFEGSRFLPTRYSVLGTRYYFLANDSMLQQFNL